MKEREIAVRAIEAYLTADKVVHRKPKAAQILVALERLGWKPPMNIYVCHPDESCGQSQTKGREE